jgi:hypothetical protein
MTTRLRVLRLVPAVMALHNAEEAMFFPRTSRWFSPVSRRAGSRLPAP